MARVMADIGERVGRQRDTSIFLVAAFVAAALLVGGCSPSPIASVAPTVPAMAPPTAFPTLVVGPTPTPLDLGVGDCDSVERSICEAAVALAFARGLDPKLGPQVVGWKVRPTVVRLCPQGLEPRLDVTFEFRDPPAVTVTVGESADGVLDACTY